MRIKKQILLVLIAFFMFLVLLYISHRSKHYLVDLRVNELLPNTTEKRLVFVVVPNHNS